MCNEDFRIRNCGFLVLAFVALSQQSNGAWSFLSLSKTRTFFSLWKSFSVSLNAEEPKVKQRNSSFSLSFIFLVWIFAFYAILIGGIRNGERIRLNLAKVCTLLDPRTSKWKLFVCFFFRVSPLSVTFSATKRSWNTFSLKRCWFVLTLCFCLSFASLWLLG